MDTKKGGGDMPLALHSSSWSHSFAARIIPRVHSPVPVPSTCPSPCPICPCPVRVQVAVMACVACRSSCCCCCQCRHCPSPPSPYLLLPRAASLPSPRAFHKGYSRGVSLDRVLLVDEPLDTPPVRVSIDLPFIDAEGDNPDCCRKKRKPGFRPLRGHSASA